MAELRLGLDHYFRDRLGFYSALSVYRPDGERESQSVDTFGLGLAFGLRWHFLRRASYSMYVDWGFGVMAGLDPFPPAGTHHNGTPHYGIGLSRRLRQDLQLLVGFRQLHMSNGKGLVSENPSFDGLGGYVGIALKPGFRAPLPRERELLPYGEADGEGGLRLRAEATLGDISEEDVPGGTLGLDLPVAAAGRLRAQLAYSAAELADEMIWDAALYVYHETSAGRLAIGYTHMEFNVFTSDFFDLQLERVLNDIGTVELVAGMEQKNLADDRVLGGLFITTFPAASVTVRTGIAFERPAHGFFESSEILNDIGLGFGLEWSPGLLARLGLSTYLEHGIGYDETNAGISFHSGGARSLRERHRNGAFVPLR